MSQQLVRDSPGPATDAPDPGRDQVRDPLSAAGRTTAPAAVGRGPAAPPAVVRLARTGKVLLKSPGLVLAALVIAVVILWAMIPGAFTHWPPDTGVPSARLKPPSAEHW